MDEMITKSIWTKNIQRITFDKHHVPGLRDFCHYNYSSAINPDPFHYHADIIEIHCLIKGERHSILDGDQGITTHLIHGNEAFITFPYELHKNGDLAQSPSEFYGFQICVRDPDHLLCFNKEYSNTLCSILLNLKHRHLCISTTELSLVRRAFNLFTSSDPADIQCGVLALSDFLFNLQYMTPAENESFREPDKNICLVTDYIQADISKNFSLKELAQISGYSLSRFKTKFKEEIGVTPADFITLQKIKYAKKILETSNKSITTIAYDLGFSSSNYFSAVFKKILNISPLQYRKEYSVNSPEKL